MFYRRESTWVEKLGIVDRETKKSLKKQLRNWVVMNVLLKNVGGLRNRAIRMGLRRAGSSMKTKIVANLLGWNRQKARMNPALTVGAAIGAGAGLMYLFDPDRGASRRAKIKDGATHAINKTGWMAGAASRDLTNRAHGVAARAGSFFRSGNTDDAILAARVRSRMGRVVSHPGAIDITALNGVIRLGGFALSREIDALLACARSTPGVHRVDNQLQIQSKDSGVLFGTNAGDGRRGARFERIPRNWSPTARALSIMAGGALMGLCVRRKDALGFTAGTIGFGLMLRGATNIEMKRIVGLGGGRRAIDFHKTININAPVDRVFEFWKNFENFPGFMRNVRDVRNLGNGRSQWTVTGPAGMIVKWNAVITEFIPNKIIAWKSEPHSTIANAGVIRFEPTPGGGSRITIRMSYNPPAGAIGHAFATILGADPKREMDQDLLRMKTMIETGHPPRDASHPVREIPPDADLFPEGMIH